MFGLIHDSIRQLFIKTYGEEFWKRAMVQAGFESGKENIVNHYYPDSDTYAIVDAVSSLAKITREDVWEMYGIQLIAYTMELGWDELLRYLSPDLKTFLNNLDSLHYFIDHVVYKANLRGPSFRCEENDDDTITLHYFTGRAGLYPIVKGVIREVARRIFNIEVTMTVSGRTQRSVQVASGERIEEHVVFIIKQGPAADESMDSARSLTGHPALQPPVEIGADWNLRLTQTDFVNLLPYHFVMDRDCKLLQIGKALANHISPDLLQYLTPVVRIFEIHRPQIPLDFENICNFINGVFVLQVRTSPLQIANQAKEGEEQMQAQHLKLKGQMMVMNGNDKIIYLCSPYVTSIPELLQYGLRLSAMPLHDATRDLILLNQQRLSDVEANLQLEANNEQLEVMAKELELEKQKTDELLKEVLPASVADQLMNGSAVDPKEFEAVTVMFTDVPGFQSVVAACKPTQIVSMLNDLFTKCDRLVTIHQAYKVETVGDSYMTVSGAPEKNEDHAERICNVALGMLYEGRTVEDAIMNKAFQVRCGIHTGSIVAGVVGQKMPRYCLFGDTVNTASRMESHSPPGRIHLSTRAKEFAETTGRFVFLSRGPIPVKGKGMMETYFLKQSLKKSIWEIIDRKRDENSNSIDGYAELNEGIEQDASKQFDKTSKVCSIM